MRILQPPGWPRPKGFSCGIVGHGAVIYVSGQIGWDADGRFTATDIAGQVRQALSNVVAILAEAGALLEHPRVLECAVVGAPDEARGTVVKAYVVLREGGGDAALVTELQDFVKARIAPYKYPRAIEFVTELPRTQTGKLQRFKLRTAAAEAKT